ncbi:MAG: glycoside hydrolase family 3 C-terminal domain-containing protein [Lachnospiraceae bacterium]|nr:glycoside hydrolase family 3 C-terminal domain-containing protein [Lachnospiraceae bacterium]
MDKQQIKNIVSQMTLEEKAGLTSGRDNWFTKGIERLGIFPVRTSDGPHGLRTQEGEENSLAEERSAKTVCFPAACLSAASFDRKLIYEMGKTLGEECQALGVNVLLGPGVNMKRSPLCGRNFEYFSEDPYLAGEMGAAFVEGVQSQGVGTSLKHYLANNQEHRRMDSSSEMDERTMREIYMSAFERVVKKAKPWTVMASYNKIGGTHTTENKKYLTEILRDEWGFEGLVVSDWGATHNRVGAVEAGCDLTMPAENTDEEIIKAVQEGRLSEEALDKACENLLSLAFKAQENQKKDVAFAYENDHELARRIVAESMVLLKNEDNILPLKKDERVAFIGPFAEKPRFQGGGSSHITCFKISNVIDTAKERGLEVLYAKGCGDDGKTDDALLNEAAELAKEAEKVVLCVGLTDIIESEGYDRKDMRMPEGHIRLIEKICKVNVNTIVVLHNGAPVEMPWVNLPKGVIEAYLAGQAVGEALLDVLYGDVNPSGHLAESFPIRLEDNPSYLYFGGENGVVSYQEGLFIGYRYYESKKMPVRFPFGYGLSYTTFTYHDLSVEKEKLDESESVKVSVKVTNTGAVMGKAVIQLYVSPEKVEAIRPVRELKAFDKVELQPGETKKVMFELEPRAFQHWNTVVHNWRTEQGKYAIQVGENARDIVLEKEIYIEAEPVPPLGGYSPQMAIGEFAKSKKAHTFLDENIIFMIKGMAANGYIPQEAMAMLEQVPGGISLDMINAMASRMGHQSGAGLDVLMAQSLGVFEMFLPEEKKQELRELIQKLNEK